MAQRKASLSTPRSRSLASGVATALAAVLLAVALTELVFAFITAPDHAASQARREAADPRARLDYDLAALSEASLFASGSPESVAFLGEEELPETDLRLVLKGTFPVIGGPDGAMIEMPDGSDYSFKVGDSLVRGVTLTAVEEYRVVITRNGRREALLLKNRPEIEAPATQQNLSPSDDSDQPDAPAQLGAAPAVQGANLETLAGPLLPMLVSQGFQAEDIPVAVDGEEISEQTSSLSSLMNLAGQKQSVVITIIRDGAERDIRLSLPQRRNP